MAYGFTPQMSVYVDRVCSIVKKIECEGGGGPGPGPGGQKVYWGNWATPLPASFNEMHFLNPATGSWAPNLGGYNSANKLTRNGTYEFSEPPAPTNWFQVLWFPNALLDVVGNPLHITVNGFTFGLQPLPDTSYGNLSINGVAGKLFVSNGTNNGGFNTASGNPMIIS